MPRSRCEDLEAIVASPPRKQVISCPGSGVQLGVLLLRGLPGLDNAHQHSKLSARGLEDVRTNYIIEKIMDGKATGIRKVMAVSFKDHLHKFPGREREHRKWLPARHPQNAHHHLFEYLRRAGRVTASRIVGV